MKPPPPLSERGLWRRVYELALHLYPRSFQEQFAPDMTRTFVAGLAEARERGPLWAAYFLAAEGLGLLVSAVRVRFGGSDEGGLPPIPGRGPRPISVLGREMRQAGRRLRRSPGFTAASVLTLGLGVGATTAVYSLVHSTVLSPLPYPDSDRILVLDHAAPGIGADRGLGMTDDLYAFYRNRTPSFEDISIWSPFDVTLSSGDPVRLPAVAVTPSFFTLLGVNPAMGRSFTESDIRSGTAGVVISNRLWMDRYGGAEDVIGRSIQANGLPMPIIGVMPSGFDFPDGRFDLWAPLDVPVAPDGIGGFSRQGIGRLAPGATRESAEREVAAVLPSLAEYNAQVEDVLADTRLRPTFPTLKSEVVRDAERTLWILLGSVVFVLVLACANVANLLLVRTESRHHEAAVRQALGAGRGDMARYYLSEAFILSTAGAALGVGLAVSAMRLLVRIGPEHLPRLSEAAVSAPALLLAGGILFLTTLAFGLGPAFRGGAAIGDTVRAAGRGVQGGLRSRARSALVATQVSLALVLLVATGLMGRSFLHLVALDPGFDARGAVTFQVGLTPAGYATREQAVAFHVEALDRIAALPGVEAAGATTCLPLCGSWAGTMLTVEGRPDDPNTVPGVVAIRRVSPEWFAAARTPLVAGRLPTRLDLDSQSGAAVISRELANDYWPGEDPIGARFLSAAGGEFWYTVVGIVENTPINGMGDDPPPMAYLPLVYQGARDVSPYQLSYVVRTTGRPQGLIGGVRDVIRSLDPTVPIAAVATLDDIVAESNVSTAFTTVVLGVAAVIALVLGLVGIYGVISYVVGRRSKEIGIRMALGAKSAQVSRGVLAEGGRVTAVGLVIGVLAAIGLTRVMESLLHGVSPTDPVTFVVVPLVLLLVALAATYIPARRAARVDPAQTLRAD